MRVQGRSQPDQAWSELAAAVFYRLEQGGSSSVSPPLALHTQLRYLRLLPDERAAALDPTLTRLVVRAQLASLVIALQGEPPLRLLAGAAGAAPGALPIETLVPTLDQERKRFGKAVLGDWSERAEAAQAAQIQQRQDALRPWLLWTVLLAGIGALGFMVWRLQRPAGPDPAAK